MQDNSPSLPYSAAEPAIPATRQQIAALCWRLKRGRVEVLLVTSRDTGRWVLPKGWPIKGKDLPASAAQEAWEEAGVRGTIIGEPLGAYGYDKLRATKPALPCTVDVFPLRVTELARKFPERAERRRKWFAASKAAKLVAEPELRDLLARVGADPLLAPFAPEPRAS